jgi:hypothetical protein
MSKYVLTFRKLVYMPSAFCASQTFSRLAHTFKFTKSSDLEISVVNVFLTFNVQMKTTFTQNESS